MLLRHKMKSLAEIRILLIFVTVVKLLNKEANAIHSAIVYKRVRICLGVQVG